MAPGAALVVLCLGVAVLVGLIGFFTDSRPMTVGAHAAEVSPTYDGHVTLDLGPVLPRLRLATNLPADIGLNLDVQETDARDVSDLLMRDALIASQPEGEIRRLHDVVVDMAVDNVIAGVGAGLFAGVVAYAGWRTVGRVRRAELVRIFSNHVAELELRLLIVLVAMLIAVAALV